MTGGNCTASEVGRILYFVYLRQCQAPQRKGPSLHVDEIPNQASASDPMNSDSRRASPHFAYFFFELAFVKPKIKTVRGISLLATAHKRGKDQGKQTK